jgi:uncharacterized protein (TIGR03437 family)
MFRRFSILILCLAPPLFASNVQLLASLPNGAVSTAIQLDRAGNIYVAGYTVSAISQSPQDAFVAKLSPDGSKLIYLTFLSGSQQDSATAMALGADGSAYVTGNTQSGDFPVSAGALQATNPRPGQLQGFLVKLDPAGAIAYATYITPLFIEQMSGIALGSGGEVFLTGIGGGNGAPGFILKLDAALSRIVMTLNGTGGGPMQLDSQGNIYVAGSAQPNVTTVSPGEMPPLPAFPPTAFQPSHNATFCVTFGSGPGGGGSSYFCRYQYVVKLNPAGSVVWATYVTGTYGAIARGIALDAAGNVIVAGTTNSDDYPVTPGAFQTAYAAAAPPFPVPPGSTFKDPPPATGYVTKVNSNGTGLIWSTYFGGSFTDRITGMAVAPTGDIVISGRAGSSDLPGLQNTPDGCRPSAVQELGFVAHIAPDGATAGPAQLISGAPDCTHLNCNVTSDYTNYFASWPVAVSAGRTAVTAGTNGAVASVDFLSAGRLACVADPADNVQLRTLAPGQLVSLFGEDLAPAASFVPPHGVSSSTSDFGVFFNGIPAPILYSSGQQINVQVPFEISGQTSVQMQIVNKQLPLPLSETHTFAVAERQPAIFLSTTALASPFPGYTQCGGTVSIGPAALAINPDGTVNDCAHPAIAGTSVTLFMNGAGQFTPALRTGIVAAPPPVTLTPGMVILGPNLSPLKTTTQTLPGSLEGVEQIQLLAPASPASTTPFAFTPTLQGVDLRERLALIWVRAE